MRTLLIALATLGCVSLRIEADGTTQLRALGQVRATTMACSAPGQLPPVEPVRTCLEVHGASMSESAGGLLSGLLGFLLGR